MEGCSGTNASGTRGNRLRNMDREGKERKEGKTKWIGSGPTGQCRHIGGTVSCWNPIYETRFLHTEPPVDFLADSTPKTAVLLLCNKHPR